MTEEEKKAIWEMEQCEEKNIMKAFIFTISQSKYILEEPKKYIPLTGRMAKDLFKLISLIIKQQKEIEELKRLNGNQADIAKYFDTQGATHSDTQSDTESEE